MESRLTSYLLSLPERVLRSAAALAGGLLHEIGGATLPEGVRKSRLYVNLVEMTLRFLIEQVGEVDGVFPSEEEWFDSAPDYFGKLLSGDSDPRQFRSERNNK